MHKCAYVHIAEETSAKTMNHLDSSKRDSDNAINILTTIYDYSSDVVTHTYISALKMVRTQ